jgi:hypothetical protein
MLLLSLAELDKLYDRLSSYEAVLLRVPYDPLLKYCRAVVRTRVLRKLCTDFVNRESVGIASKKFENLLVDSPKLRPLLSHRGLCLTPEKT